jgi:hypothetical protein
MEAQAEALVGMLREPRDADLSLLATKDELKAEIAWLDATMNAGFAAIPPELEILRRDVTIRLGAMIVVAIGALLVAKFFG